MQKILGLDIGSYSVKAVEVINHFSHYEVTQFKEIVVPEIEGLDEGTLGLTALRQLLEEYAFVPDKTYTGMMGLFVLLRVLKLPANVKKRFLAEIIGGELEAQSPFSENAVMDHQILGLHPKDNQLQALAVMARKEQVAAYLEGLNDLGIEPKVIDVDCLAWMNLIPHMPKEYFEAEEGEKEPITMVLDIGHLKTSIVLFKGTQFQTTRVIRMAGKFFTDFLSRSMKLSYQDAQRLKHKVAAASFSTHQGELKQEEKCAKYLGLAITELTREILRTLVTFRASDELYPHQIFLTGGSARIEGLREYLAESVGATVRAFTFDDSKVHCFHEESGPEIASFQGIALAFRGVPHKQQSQINLRKGELAFVGGYDRIIRQISLAITIFLGMICLCGATYGVSWWLYNGRLEKTQKTYQTEVRKILGTEPSSLRARKKDMNRYTREARRLINQKIRSQEEVLAEFKNQKTAVPLRVLKLVSETIPKELEWELSLFKVDKNTVELKGTTQDRNMGQAIFEKLTKVTGITFDPNDFTQSPKPGKDEIIITLKGEVHSGAL